MYIYGMYEDINDKSKSDGLSHWREGGFLNFRVKGEEQRVKNPCQLVN